MQTAVATMAIRQTITQSRPDTKLMEIYSDLERLIETSVVDQHVPGSVIAALFSFSRNELTNEENLMDASGLPFEQKKEIANFKLKVFSFLASMQFGHPPLACEVRDFLNDWIRNNLIDEQVKQVLDRR
jgi:hypothetical protein